MPISERQLGGHYVENRGLDGLATVLSLKELSALSYILHTATLYGATALKRTSYMRV